MLSPARVVFLLDVDNILLGYADDLGALQALRACGDDEPRAYARRRFADADSD